ncbi:exopolysaccharide biosynthesis GT4 family glycosyltransferase EpsE [Planktotalea sp.]|uniref:exopolysaccharide biosynthesis GT4 family glycosyltransferase EpsE n=1 Tax=Planktotalea sp. TaxID=2029877 RepID=UPI00329A6A89
MHTDTDLRLGYLVPQFPGQTHIFFWREIAELEKRGVDVHLLSTQPPPKGLIAHDWSAEAIARTTYLASKNPFDLLRAALKQPWMQIVRQMHIDGSSVARDIAICLPAAVRLLNYARAHSLDHIHVHSCARAALIAAICKHMGGPTFSVTLHGPMSDYGRGQPLKWRDASFATIITRKLEAEAKSELGDAFPEHVYIRPMGVDTNVLKRKTAYVPPKADDTLKIFSCARLNVVKGHQNAMEAVHLLVQQGIDVLFEIAGEDDAGGSGYRRVLEQRIIDLGLADHVRLLGAIDADAVKAKLLEAHMFVLASWHEPLGVAYMEAMSCGVPTIGTNSGGVPEMITSGETAILVEPKAPEELAQMILELSQQPSELNRLSVDGRAHIVANFHAALGAETLIDGINATRS